MAQYPHSPGDVIVSGDRQNTLGYAPRVDTEFIRRQPLLTTGHGAAAIGMMPVWIAPHRRESGDIMGGQWLWTSSNLGSNVGPLAVPITPILEPAQPKAAETALGASEPSRAKASEQMKAQYQALQRSLGITPTEGVEP